MHGRPVMLAFCPYPECGSTHLRKAGFTEAVSCIGGKKRQRFLCVACRRKFSENATSLNFRLKKSDLALNAKIFYLCLEGLSNRAIARFYYLSEHCVRLRLRRMSQQALNFHWSAVRTRPINEAICFDGLENFAGSQYDVNNIHHAIGRDSLFTYDFNFASLNRKGFMSPWQKIRLQEIEAESGRYPPNSIRTASRDIIERLSSRCTSLNLLSDEHFQYRRVVQQDLKDREIAHVTVSSKACRNFQNILFPVNHADLMIRQQIGAFSRETIAFSKTAGAMCQKYALYMVYKNYMAPQFTKKHVRRPEAHIKSPAQHLGIENKLLSFADVFHRRSTVRDTEIMSDDWKSFWHGQIPSKYERMTTKTRRRA